MFKAWINMWKNTFNYTGTVTRKDYWLALIMNVIAMYVLLIPYALVTIYITDNLPVAATIYLVVFNLPALSIYFRRARDAEWKTGTAIYTAITLPIISGLIVGMPIKAEYSKGDSLTLKILALSAAISLYSGVLSFILYGSPNELPVVTTSGIFLGAFTLIVYGIINREKVIALWSGSNID